jgi:hypothetical protein
VVLQEAHLREEVLLPAEDHLVEAQKKNKQSTSKKPEIYFRFFIYQVISNSAIVLLPVSPAGGDIFVSFIFITI